MTKSFYAKLVERVLSTFAFAFLAAWTLGLGSVPSLHQVADLSLAQKAAAAGGAAVAQLLASVFIAPRIGDPNSPSLLPARFTGKVPVTAPEKQSIVVSVDDVISATLKRVGANLPAGLAVTAEDVAQELIGQVTKAADAPVPLPAPSK